MSRLDPKTKKGFDLASEKETIRYPLASNSLTYALNGGIGAGRLTAIYGNFSAGKSMLCLQSVAMWQKMGLSIAWADVEGAFDREFAETLGVDPSKLLITGSKSAETLGNQMQELIKAEIDVIVVDSISAIMPASFIEKDGSLKEADSRKQLGAHAKGIKSVLDALLYDNTHTAVVLISQTTTEIGQTYTKQIPHGGKGLGFATSQMIKLTSSNTDAKQIKGLVSIGDLKIEQPIGRTVEVVVEKNKLGRQSTTAKYDIYYAGELIGIDTIGELVDMCTEYAVIEKGGAWFTVEGERFQGRASVVKAVKANQKLEETLKKKLESILYA